MTNTPRGTKSPETSPRGHQRTKVPYPQAALVKDKSRYSVTVFRKTPQDIYKFWRDFKNLPSFMKDLVDIKIYDEKSSLWKIKLENGLTAEWTAEIVKDIPGEQISWKSTADSEVQTEGTVWFMPATNGMGTVVGMNMNYQVRGGKLGELVAALSGESPNVLSHINLKRLKALLETGEVPTIEGQSSGREGDNK